MDSPPSSPTAAAISRRSWVKRFMLGSVATLSGPEWLGSILAEVTSTGPGPAVIRLKASEISLMIADESGIPTPTAVLAAPGGSVQYGFNTGLPPFTLNRVAVDRFVALDSVCTHNGCAVGRYRTHVVGLDESVSPPLPILAKLMRCPCHGSRYDIEGRVFRDSQGVSTEPARSDLARFETSYDPDTDIVSVRIPGLALHVRSISVHRKGPGESVRLKLVIPVTAYSSYDVSHMDGLSGPMTRIAFATTAEGPATQTILSSTRDGDVTIYVDTTGSTGFFVVGLILEDMPE